MELFKLEFLTLIYIKRVKFRLIALVPPFICPFSVFLRQTLSVFSGTV